MDIVCNAGKCYAIVSRVGSIHAPTEIDEKEDEKMKLKYLFSFQNLNWESGQPHLNRFIPHRRKPFPDGKMKMQTAVYLLEGWIKCIWCMSAMSRLVFHEINSHKQWRHLNIITVIQIWIAEANIKKKKRKKTNANYIKPHNLVRIHLNSNSALRWSHTQTNSLCVRSKYQEKNRKKKRKKTIYYHPNSTL